MLLFGRFFRRTDKIVERVPLRGIRAIVKSLVVQAEFSLMQEEIVRWKWRPFVGAGFLRRFDARDFPSTVLTVGLLYSTGEDLNEQVAALTTVVIGEILGAWIVTTNTSEVVRSEEVALRSGTVRADESETWLRTAADRTKELMRAP